MGVGPGRTGPAWLREGFKFHLRLRLESGQLTWSSVMGQHALVFRFAAFLAARGIDQPALVSDPARELRALALDIRTFVQGWTKQRADRRSDTTGGSLAALTIPRSQQGIDLFYRVMSDYRDEAAARSATNGGSR